MVPTETVRQILMAVATGLPDAEHSFISGLDVHSGYGNAVHVRLRTPHPRTPMTSQRGSELRAAVGRALADQNHTVSIAWSTA
jgi:hypothetical protein